MCCISQPKSRTDVRIPISEGGAMDADALNVRGFETYLDKKDILPGEPWQERLDALILSADAIGGRHQSRLDRVSVCGWEAERTESLQKKLLPLLYRPVADADLPPRPPTSGR
jgi:hypothetical protein